MSYNILIANDLTIVNNFCNQYQSTLYQIMRISAFAKWANYLLPLLLSAIFLSPINTPIPVV